MATRYALNAHNLTEMKGRGFVFASYYDNKALGPYFKAFKTEGMARKHATKGEIITISDLQKRLSNSPQS